MTTSMGDQARVADLTVGQLKMLMRDIVNDAVQRAIYELEQQLPDPDAGKAFTTEFSERLARTLDSDESLLSLDDVKRELGKPREIAAWQRG